MDACFDEGKFLVELNKSAQLPDEILREYELVDLIKPPAEQTVYKLKRRSDGEYYILKCGAGESRANIKSEREILTELAGLDIVPEAVALFEKGDRAFLIEKYIPGETVAQRVERVGVMTYKEALPIWLGLCDILACLHKRSPSVIHRDIKPDHIIISPDGKVRIIDFGIARRLREGQSRDTRFYGTEQTAAPEQFGFRQTDCRTDIYAMGVTMRYMLTGFYDMSKPVGGAPKRVTRIIDICCNFNPADRFESAAKLRRKLQKLDRQLRRPVTLAICALAVAAAIIFIPGLINSARTNRIYAFKEPRIEQAVRKELSIPLGAPVRASDLQNVKKLALLDSREADTDRIDDYIEGQDIYGYEDLVFDGSIVSAEDVGLMTNLVELALINQDIHDITPLAGLTRLEKLSVYGNRIKDMSPLAGLTNLKMLNIGYNPATDMTAVASLTRLETLDIHLISADSFDFLRTLRNLTYFRMMAGFPLDGDFSPITDLKNLKMITAHNISAPLIGVIGNGELPKLETLNLSGAKTELNGDDTAALSQLTTLNLWEVPLSDSSILRRLTNLKELRINYAPESVDFSFLDKMPGLRLIDIRGTVCDDYRPFLLLSELTDLWCDEAAKSAIKSLYSPARLVIRS